MYLAVAYQQCSAGVDFGIVRIPLVGWRPDTVVLNRVQSVPKTIPQFDGRKINTTALNLPVDEYVFVFRVVFKHGRHGIVILTATAAGPSTRHVHIVIFGTISVR